MSSLGNDSSSLLDSSIQSGKSGVKTQTKLTEEQRSRVEQIYKAYEIQFYKCARRATRGLCDRNRLFDLIHESVTNVISRPEIFSRSDREIAGLIIMKIVGINIDYLRSSEFRLTRRKNDMELSNAMSSEDAIEKMASQILDKPLYESLLDRLPNREREVFALHYSEFTGEEIAHILKISPSTVSRTLASAIAILQSIITQERDYP